MTQQTPDPWGNPSPNDTRSQPLPQYQQPPQQQQYKPQQYMPGPLPPQYQQPTQPQPPVVVYQPVYQPPLQPVKQAKKWYQNGWIITGLVIVVLAIIGGASNAGKTSNQAAATPTALPAVAQAQAQPTRAVGQPGTQATAAALSSQNTQTDTKVITAEPTKTASLPGLNQVVTVGEVQLKVLGVANAGNSIEYTSFGNKLMAVGTWIKVDIAIGNVSNKTKSLGTWDFKLHDAQGRTYDASTDSFTYALFKDLKSPSDPIPPGSAIQTTLLFDVTSNATGLQLEAAPDFKKQLFQLS